MGVICHADGRSASCIACQRESEKLDDWNPNIRNLDDVVITTLSDMARVLLEKLSPVAVTFGVENRWALPCGRNGNSRTAETVDTTITTLVTVPAKKIVTFLLTASHE